MIESGDMTKLGSPWPWPLQTRSTSAAHLTRRAAAALVLLASLLLLAGAVLIAPSPAHAATPTYQVITGSDRYDTALKLSRAFAPGVEGVVVAPGWNFPDALAAGPLAHAYGGPVLLVPQTGLTSALTAELGRLAPGKVFLVGLPDDPFLAQVQAALPGLDPANVVVVRGIDRYETAALIAGELHARLGMLERVVIVPGDKFPDALACGPLAAARGWAILLTPAAGPLPDATTQALVDLGVTEAIAAGTYATPGLDGFTMAARFVGTDRYDTAAKVAAYSLAQGLSFAHVAVTTGENFPDALAAGPYLARDDGMILLTTPGGVPAPTANTLAARVSDLERIDFVGLSNMAIWQVWPFLPFDAPPSTPTLGWPSSGAAVAWLEARLTALTYRPGPIDGVYDEKTYNAVIAFQKWEGLTRDGRVTADDWAELMTATVPVAHATGTGSWVEVDKARQVLLYIEEGVVLKTLHVSTGTWDVAAETPSGDFTVYKRYTGWIWHVYYPCFFTSWPGAGEIAVHGYDSVPTQPASHGCVRVCVWDMPELFDQLPIGGRIVVY